MVQLAQAAKDEDMAAMKAIIAGGLVYCDQAIFDGDKVGDVLAGLDDDGDPGPMWLYKGTGPGQFNTPIAVTVDMDGRVLVTDKNHRVQVR